MNPTTDNSMRLALWCDAWSRYADLCYKTHRWAAWSKAIDRLRAAEERYASR